MLHILFKYIELCTYPLIYVSFKKEYFLLWSPSEVCFVIISTITHLISPPCYILIHSCVVSCPSLVVRMTLTDTMSKNNYGNGGCWGFGMLISTGEDFRIKKNVRGALYKLCMHRIFIAMWPHKDILYCIF